MRRFLAFALACLACSERNFPEPVSMGVARLTVKNLAMLTQLADRDDRCGFSSEAAKRSMKISGAPGERGSVTWTIDACTIELGRGEPISETCREEKTFGEGRVVIRGTKTITGLLTGDSNQPVIPDGPEAARLELLAELDRFAARSASRTPALTMVSGKISWSVSPRLAASASKGICMVPTMDAAFSDIRYDGAKVYVESGERSFFVDVPRSSFWAQVGRSGDRENWLEGEITVWDATVHLPTRDDRKGLDPSYDRARFIESYACRPDLAQPVDAPCAPVRDRLAQGAAQLWVKAFGNLVSLVENDSACGFASVNAKLETSGALGERGGTAVWRLDQPCRIESAPRRRIRTDCLGVGFDMTGAVTVTGRKVLRGISTGDPTTPIVPTSRDAVDIELTARFEGFTLSDTASARTFTIHEGAASGRMSPRLALDTRTGACSITTPVARFQLSIEDARVAIQEQGVSLGLRIDRAELEAQSGAGSTHSNHLVGTMVTDGATLSIPAAGDPVLDPAYEPAAFDATYRCVPHLEVPASDDACSFTRPLAEAAARLLVQSTGLAANLTNADKGCGFENTGVKLDPDDVQGAPGEMGSMTWKIQGCRIASATPRQIDTNCVGTRRFFAGEFTVAATRKVTGERTKTFLFFDSIIPRSRDAVTIELNEVLAAGFEAYTVASGATAPDAKLVLESGRVSAVVRPLLGERKSQPGTFDIPTPVASIRLSANGLKAKLMAQGKTFRLDIPEARLDAFNGSYRGVSNRLSGTIKLGDELVTLGELPLDPAFDQAAFDRGYACTDDLKEVIPP